MIRKYVKLLVEHPMLFILIFIFVTMFLGVGALHVGTRSTDYTKVLPENFPEISAFDYIKYEYGSSGSTVSLLIIADSVLDIRYVL